MFHSLSFLNLGKKIVPSIILLRIVAAIISIKLGIVKQLIMYTQGQEQDIRLTENVYFYEILNLHNINNMFGNFGVEINDELIRLNIKKCI